MSRDKHVWPTREEWARDCRTLFGPPTISHELSLYASEQEIAALKSALYARRRQYAVGSYERDGVNRALKLIKENKLPILLSDYLGAKDLIAPYLTRYETELERRTKIAADETKTTPVDDAAWAREMKRRAGVEAYLKSLDEGRHVKATRT